MGYDLSVSAKRDPGHARPFGERADATHATHASIALRGELDEAAARAVLQTVVDLARDGTCSIFVELGDVRADDPSCLRTFAANLMAQRSAGVHVQVAVRNAALHAEMAGLADSRDWLLACTEADDTLPRRAIHVDGINEAG